ncbi:unnamed protein product [Amoebophrya sp. A120]|nr:unnamed protein product [Amoebophrya sp. A120]|eukprot:GSA120T00013392001.1
MIPSTPLFAAGRPQSLAVSAALLLSAFLASRPVLGASSSRTEGGGGGVNMLPPQPQFPTTTTPATRFYKPHTFEKRETGFRAGSFASRGPSTQFTTLTGATGAPNKRKKYYSHMYAAVDNFATFSSTPGLALNGASIHFTLRLKEKDSWRQSKKAKASSMSDCRNYEAGGSGSTGSAGPGAPSWSSSLIEDEAQARLGQKSRPIRRQRGELEAMSDLLEAARVKKPRLFSVAERVQKIEEGRTAAPAAAASTHKRKASPTSLEQASSSAGTSSLRQKIQDVSEEAGTSAATTSSSPRLTPDAKRRKLFDSEAPAWSTSSGTGRRKTSQHQALTLQIPQRIRTTSHHSTGQPAFMISSGSSSTSPASFLLCEGEQEDDTSRDRDFYLFDYRVDIGEKIKKPTIVYDWRNTVAEKFFQTALLEDVERRKEQIKTWLRKRPNIMEVSFDKTPGRNLLSNGLAVFQEKPQTVEVLAEGQEACKASGSLSGVETKTLVQQETVSVSFDVPADKKEGSSSSGRAATPAAKNGIDDNYLSKKVFRLVLEYPANFDHHRYEVEYTVTAGGTIMNLHGDQLGTSAPSAVLATPEAMGATSADVTPRPSFGAKTSTADVYFMPTSSRWSFILLTSAARNKMGVSETGDDPSSPSSLRARIVGPQRRKDRYLPTALFDEETAWSVVNTKRAASSTPAHGRPPRVAAAPGRATSWLQDVGDEQETMPILESQLFLFDFRAGSTRTPTEMKNKMPLVARVLTSAGLINGAIAASEIMQEQGRKAEERGRNLFKFLAPGVGLSGLFVADEMENQMAKAKAGQPVLEDPAA